MQKPSRDIIEGSSQSVIRITSTKDRGMKKPPQESLEPIFRELGLPLEMPPRPDNVPPALQACKTFEEVELFMTWCPTPIQTSSEYAAAQQAVTTSTKGARLPAEAD
jgi:hypothetical protein